MAFENEAGLAKNNGESWPDLGREATSRANGPDEGPADEEVEGANAGADPAQAGGGSSPDHAPRKRKSGRPVSERKRAANRANAQNSTGPRTEAGKNTVRWNSLKRRGVRLLGLAQARALNQEPGAAEQLYRDLIAPYNPPPAILALHLQDLARLHLELQAWERIGDAQLEHRWQQNNIKRRRSIFELQRDLVGLPKEVIEQGLYRLEDSAAKFHKILEALDLLRDHLTEGNLDFEPLLHMLYGKNPEPLSARAQTFCKGCQKLIRQGGAGETPDPEIDSLLDLLDTEEEDMLLAYGLHVDENTLTRTACLSRLGARRRDRAMDLRGERLRTAIDRKQRIITELIKTLGLAERPAGKKEGPEGPSQEPISEAEGDSQEPIGEAEANSQEARGNTEKPSGAGQGGGARGRSGTEDNEPINGNLEKDAPCGSDRSLNLACSGEVPKPGVSFSFATSPAPSWNFGASAPGTSAYPSPFGYPPSPFVSSLFPSAPAGEPPSTPQNGGFRAEAKNAQEQSQEVLYYQQKGSKNAQKQSQTNPTLVALTRFGGPISSIESAWPQNGKLHKAKQTHRCLGASGRLIRPPQFRGCQLGARPVGKDGTRSDERVGFENTSRARRLSARGADLWSGLEGLGFGLAFELLHFLERHTSLGSPERSGNYEPRRGALSQPRPAGLGPRPVPLSESEALKGRTGEGSRNGSAAPQGLRSFDLRHGRPRAPVARAAARQEARVSSVV